MPHLKKLKELRQAIRSHRDQKGDDRCWLDDPGLWALVDGSISEPKAPPPFEEMMAACRAFYVHRRSDAPDAAPADAVTDPTKWDDDLVSMADDAVRTELTRTEDAIRAHRDVSGRPRTLDDDRRLYAILPERLPADFRLPPEDEFLGEAKKPTAGCPSFWRSHQSCPCAEHDPHRWGPCC
jgi:hypothetical protein